MWIASLMSRTPTPTIQLAQLAGQGQAAGELQGALGPGRTRN